MDKAEGKGVSITNQLCLMLTLVCSGVCPGGERIARGKEGVYVCWGWITRTGKSKLGDTRLEQHGGRSDLDHKDKL